MKINDIIDKITSIIDSDPEIENLKSNKYCFTCNERYPDYFTYCPLCFGNLEDISFMSQARKKNKIESERTKKFYNYPNSKNETFQQNLNTGAEFENYIEKIIFPNHFYSVVHRTSHPSQSKTLSDDGKPDLIFRANFLDEKPCFAIECKYHKSLYSKVYTLNKKEVEEFREFMNDKRIPIFVVVGIGGESSRPESLFVIPFKHKYFNDKYFLENKFFIKKEYLTRFQVKCDYPLDFNNNCLFNSK